MGCPQEGPLFAGDSAVDGGLEDTNAGDAAVTDGGLADARETDAANDTGVTDSATADTGHMDAGTDTGPTVVPMAWDGTLPDQGVCTPDGFCAVYPLPTPMAAVVGWVRAADDIWLGGELGLLIHWDGTAWRGVSSTGGDIRRIHGCASDDVWAVQSDSTVSLDADVDTPLVDMVERLLHWDGTAWEAVPLPSGLDRLTEVHCVAPDDVWVPGAFGSIHRWNGTSWSSESEVAGVVTRLGAVAEVDGNVVIAGMPNSVVWDGTDFQPLPTAFRVREFARLGTTLYALHPDGVHRLQAGVWTEEPFWIGGQSIASDGTNVRVLDCERGANEAFQTSGGGSWARVPGRCGGGAVTSPSYLLAVEGVGFLELSYSDPTTGTFGHIHGVLPATHVQDNPVDFSPSAARTMVDDTHWYVEEGGDILERGFDGTSTTVTSIPFGRVVHWERNNLWVEETSTRTAHFDGTDWTEFRTDPMIGVSLDLIATATEAWGVSRGSHTGGLYRWQAASGWERVEDAGIAEVWATGEDVWVRQVDGRVGRFQDGAITLLPVVDGGSKVQELMPVEAPGSGQVWVLLGASGSHQLGLWTGDAWRVITPPVPGWARDTRNWKTLVAVSGPNVWTTNRRLVGDEWIPYRVGLNMEIRDVTVSQGSVWITAVEAMSRLPL